MDYVEGVLFATFFWGMAYVFSQFIRLNGSPKFASLMFITSSLTNIILDAIFIVVLKLGISGAAWATAFSYIIAFIIGFSYFFNPKCKIKIIKVYGGWNYIFKAILNGFSEFLSNISSGIIPWLFNITAYKILGNNGILIYSAANYIITFFIMIALQRHFTLMSKGSVKLNLLADSGFILADGLCDGSFRGTIRNTGENDTPFLQS